MNILLFGKNGQVGWELQRALAPIGNVTALATGSINYCGDFNNTAGIVETIRTLRPDVIVNAAAYTAVDKAESEREMAQRINATTVEAIAKEAQQLGAWLIHYSTDYVFPGTGTDGWKETDATSPLNFYGESKLAGEQAIQRHCKKYLIFRTSWVYATKGNNFAKTMIRLAKERSELAIIDDQFGAPTGAELLADSAVHALMIALKNEKAAGLYHLAAAGTTSWFEYASMVFDVVQKTGIELKVTSVKPIPTASYPTPAQRPLNSRLDTRSFQQTFGLNLPSWQQGVIRMLEELSSLKAL
ncbi:dTDP-4-dehydrorhamnose reductase [Erwinia sp. MMLR14_017]|uniref:dTDP-4-dehydrorhamnose reductase n=1 Tax=Erwinia sp. MMLR14_017 TaxID=3093842 RepID=UPI0029900690|nr:dTDP-4-dehydrorhamnose reductase [Erwinia sp. MMLR14_017]MDW8847210.1 dTDP-4-dehydrorhamnose reductase [Erwinia sp. MMLR14_017]